MVVPIFVHDKTLTTKKMFWPGVVSKVGKKQQHPFANSLCWKGVFQFHKGPRLNVLLRVDCKSLLFNVVIRFFC